MRAFIYTQSRKIASIMALLVIGDIIAIFAMIGIAGGLFFLTPWYLKSRVSGIEIMSGSQTVGQFSLESDRILDVQGILGNTQIRINDGKASVVSSPCSNKYCLNMGHIGESGGILVCVPNEIIVSSVKKRDDDLDAVSR